MKKFGIMLAALLLLAACKPEDKPAGSDPSGTSGGGLKELTFTATLQPLTKTSITGEENLIWARNDQVSVFDGEGNRSFKIRSSAASANLTGEAKEADGYYALYPYDSKATLDKGVISTTIPATQTAATADATGFAGLVAAKSSGTEMSFSHLTGILKFTLSPDAAGVTGLEIRSGGAALSGAVQVNLSGSTPVLSVESGSPSLYVEPSGDAFQPGETYYVYTAANPSLTGVSVTAYQGSEASRTEIPSPLNVQAGAIVNLGTIGVGTDDSASLLYGKWAPVRYGSRSVSDTEGKYVWWSDVNGKTLSSSADNTITFVEGGELQVDLGPDGYAFNEAAGDFLPVFDNPRWALVKEGTDSYLQFSGGAFPALVANGDGINGKYHIVSLGSGELQLEMLRNNDEGDSWFQIVLQPFDVETFSHLFVDGDFGISGGEDYKLSGDGETEDSHFGTAVLEGFKWTMTVDSDDIFYAYDANSGIRVGIGNWREEVFTPKQVTFSTEAIPGKIKAVRIKACHNNGVDDVDVDVSATVGGLPFGTRYKLQHESQVYSFTSLEEASGKIEIDLKKNKGLYGLLIQSIEVLYQSE